MDANAIRQIYLDGIAELKRHPHVFHNLSPDKQATVNATDAALSDVADTVATAFLEDLARRSKFLRRES